MTTHITTEEVINLAVQAGATVLSDKQETSGTCQARNVYLQKPLNDGKSCQIKASYMKLGEKLITVQCTCCCNESGTWNPISQKCLDNNFSSM